MNNKGIFNIQKVKKLGISEKNVINKKDKLG